MDVIKKQATEKKQKKPTSKETTPKESASLDHPVNDSIAKQLHPIQQTQTFVGILAEEIAKTVVDRLPKMLTLPAKKKTPKQKEKKIENAIFLDTSAIIDGRVFDLANLGVFTGTFVVMEGVLLELKHIADSSDVVKKERGRKGLEALEKLKKNKKVKVSVLPPEKPKDPKKEKEVDEQLIQSTKHYKGKLITCDYNLEKKATISGVTAINMNALAQALKVVAVPGEALSIKILHPGKDTTQGVGYLEDGTMLVVEKGSNDIGKTIDVIVARVIQTASGRILFAKKMP